MSLDLSCVSEKEILAKAPLRDYGFHKIFDPSTEDGRECLRFLLASICGISANDVETLLPRRYEGEKGEKKNSESDIRIMVDDKYRVIIEMQLVATKEFFLRSGFYAASEVTEIIGAGEKHTEFKQTILICIMDEVRTSHNKDICIKRSYMHSDTPEERIGFPYVYDVYLGNLMKKEIDFESYDIETILAVFAHIMYNKDEEELREKIKQYIMKGEGSIMAGLDKINSKVEYICIDEEEKARLIKEYWDYQIQKGLERVAREEGIEEGIKEGIKEGSANTLKQNIRTMHDNGLDTSQIAMYLSLEVEYVKKVLSE